MSKTYECSICNNVNHVSKIHCSTCGTIPSFYSPLGHPTVTQDRGLPINALIPVYVAYGAERQKARRTIKRVARTVPLDYYAEL